MIRRGGFTGLLLAVAGVSGLVGCGDAAPSTVERPRAERTSATGPREFLWCRHEGRDCTGVATFEDGSGIQYVRDREVRTFPEGTFVWDCSAQGNRRCGGAR